MFNTLRNFLFLRVLLRYCSGLSALLLLLITYSVDGGATVIGMKQVLESKPDGYTLIIVPSMMGTTDVNLPSFKTVGIKIFAL